MTPEQNNYSKLLDTIGNTIQSARFLAVKAVNTELVKVTGKLAGTLLNMSSMGKNAQNMEATYYQDFPKI
jgi:hypothetical protein